MTLHAPRSSDPPAGGHRELWVRGLVRLALLGPFVGALLFGAAGTLAWSRGWVFIALLLLTLGANLTLMLRRNPELVRERWKRREDTKPFDKVFGVFYLLSLPALFVVAGLDAGRFGWTTMPSELLWVGIALHVLGLVPILAALLFNPHLETTVRIQKDRDHQVVTDGPYRVVRHPMYVGIIVMSRGVAARARLLGSDGGGGRARGALRHPNRPRGPHPPRGAAGLRGLHEADPLSPAARRLVRDGAVAREGLDDDVGGRRWPRGRSTSHGPAPARRRLARA
jgi:protein-S-isoprenylcysteine O-methyltransferase Ste14